MGRTIPVSEERILRMTSRGCCAKCKRDLAAGDRGDESNLSEMAHIHGVGRGSARHDPAMIPDDLNSHRNLILLCRNCHKIVDDDPVTYSPDRLEAMKSDHEAWARRQLVRDSNAVSFAELEVIAKWMAAEREAEPARDYHVTPPLKKIKKNGLSRIAQTWIEIGMSKSHLVGKYIENQPDPAFGDRLKARFHAIYRGYREDEGLDADDTFFRMLEMDEAVLPTKGRTPAVLAIMVYLFEKCEVFER